MKNSLQREAVIDALKRSYNMADTSRLIYGDNSRKLRKRITDFCLREKIDYKDLFLKKDEKHYYCKFCGKEILGKERSRKQFCNSSCAASYNNRGKKHNEETKIKISKTLQEKNPNFDGVFKTLSNKETFCLNCGKKMERVSDKSKFCSIECFSSYKSAQNVNKWLNNELNIDANSSLPLSVRKYLLEKNDYKCELCGFEGYNKKSGKTILQFHHIDGDSSHNNKENIQVLCPNCHAMTENFMALNKGHSTRDKRYKK